MGYLVISIKTILFYVILIIILRIMGKREVGELSIFDVVVFFIISELFSLSLNGEGADDFITILHALIPIAIIVALQILTSYLALKFEKVRNLVDGKPVIIIHKGKINQKQMKKQRYNIDDLFTQLRQQGTDSISDIEYAILESTGTLTVIKKQEKLTQWPMPFVKDGKIDKQALQEAKMNEKWLDEQLKMRGIKSLDEVFLAIYEVNGLRVITKELAQNQDEIEKD